MNEIEFIGKLAMIFGQPPHPNIGIGDDAAVIRPKPNLDSVWTTDTQVEGIHFRREWMRPREIGRRAATAALSDIAAMGALPAYALVSFQTPRNRVNELLDIAHGIKDRFSKFDATVVGGNISRSPTLSIDISVIGSIEKGMVLLRSGVRPGDDLFVTGLPGCGAVALAFLDRFGRKGIREPIVRRWIKAEPRIQCGRKLLGLATSAIDISDGLLADAEQLAKASKVTFEIDVTPFVMSRIYKRVTQKLGRSTLELLSAPSDDYELLFSAPPSARAKILRAFRGEAPTWIGRAKRGNGKLTIVSRGTKVALSNHGWDHLVNND